MMFFLCFTLIFKVFINIHEYANKIICIFDHGIKGLLSKLSFGTKFSSLQKVAAEM